MGIDDPIPDYTIPPNDLATTISTLRNLAVNKYPEILINSKSNTATIRAQLKDYLSRTETLNQEFSERYAVTGPENPLPFFAVNQDLLLFLFSFTYSFFILVSAYYTNKLTDSVAKGFFVVFLGAIVYLLMLGFLIQFG